MMGFLWFWLVAVMIVGYVVLDGFDLGVGVLHLFLVRTEAERRSRCLHRPVWDGNEVWLLAGGGTLYFAFPLLYASAFSGFYLPLMIVLWLLVLRGVSLELRNHIDVGVGALLRRRLRPLERAAHHLLRSGTGQRAARRAVAGGRLLLPTLVDQLAARPAPRHSRLVHGDWRLVAWLRSPARMAASICPLHRDLREISSARLRLVFRSDSRNSSPHRPQPRSHHPVRPASLDNYSTTPIHVHCPRRSCCFSAASGHSIATSTR